MCLCCLEALIVLMKTRALHDLEEKMCADRLSILLLESIIHLHYKWEECEFGESR